MPVLQKPASLLDYPGSPGISRLPFAPTSLTGPRDAGHGKVIGVNHHGEEPDINSGTSYTDYHYWSLYGTRISPPPNYPQKVMHTNYDKEMRLCSPLCTYSDNMDKCLYNCMVRAAKAQKTLMDVGVLLHEAKEVKDYLADHKIHKSLERPEPSIF